VSGTAIEWLAALVGVGCAAVVAVRPTWAFGVLVAASIWVEVIHAGTDSSWQYVPWILPALVVLWLAVRTRPLFDGRPPALVWWAGAYALEVLVSAVIHRASGDWSYAVGVPVVMLTAMWALPRVTRAVGGDAWRQLVMVTAAATALLSLAAGVAALGFHVGFPVPVGHRTLLAWQWPFANKNTLGFLTAFGVPAAAVVLIDLERRWWWWAVGGLALLGLGLSYARTGWIAAAVGVLVVILVAYGRRGLTWGVVGLVAAFLLVVAKTGVHRLANLFAHGLSGRTQLWRAALTVAGAHVVDGVGPGQSPAALAPLVPPQYAGLTPSNGPLETLVELGVVGLLLWVGVVASAVAAAWTRAATLRRFGLWLGLGAAGLVEQLAESSFLGGISFEDYLFLAVLAVVLCWPESGSRARPTS